MVVSHLTQCNIKILPRLTRQIYYDENYAVGFYLLHQSTFAPMTNDKVLHSLFCADCHSRFVLRHIYISGGMCIVLIN